MITLTELYTWQQAAAKNKLEKLQVELQMVSFTIEGETDNVFSLSRYAAVEGMNVFSQRVEEGWQKRKDELFIRYPKFDFDKRFKIEIYNQPTGELISLDRFVGFDYQNQLVNIQDYHGFELAHALLEPPYNIKINIEAQFNSEEYLRIKAKEFTTLYRMFLNDFILLSKYQKEDFVIYSWSNDWSNFFDAGKEWWGTYYWTVYNKKNNTIIVLGASETD